MATSIKLTNYESEFIGLMSQANAKMTELSESGLMSEEALRLMGAEQMALYNKVKVVFTDIEKMFKSEYYKKRVDSGETSLVKKRMTELEKRRNAVLHPELYYICERCDRIFTTKCNIARHREQTLLCGVIKQGKKGTLKVNNHRSKDINGFIVDHLYDSDSGDELDENV